MLKRLVNSHVILIFLLSYSIDFHRGLCVANAVDLTQAKSAYSSKNYEQVIQLLSKKIESLDRAGLILLAKAYGDSGNSASAIKTLTAILANQPKDVEAKSLLGREQFKMGKDREALVILKEALEINAQYEPAYLYTAEIYEKRKNKYELRLLFQDLVEKLGEKPKYMNKLCEIVIAESLYDLSAKYCRRAIQLDVQHPMNYIYLAQTFKETGEKEQAQKYYTAAAKKFPKSDAVQIAVAQYYDDQKSFIKSYQHYRSATLANSKNAIAWAGLGTSAMEIQKYDESIKAFLQACQLDKSALSAFRKAVNFVRTAKLGDWSKKYESGLEKCGLQGATDKN